jgi:hypothetical protein
VGWGGGYSAYTESITQVDFRDKTYGWKRFGFAVRLVMKSKIEAIHFRDKRRGWKRYHFFLRFLPSDFVERRLVEPSDKNVFLKGFLRDLYLRPSCHECPSKQFTSGSDITLADYWGIQNILPDFDDDKGVSLVMINTPKAVEFCHGLDAEFVETSYSDAFGFNPSIEKSVKSNKNRSLFFQSIGKGNIIRLINKYSRTTLKEQVRNRIIRILIKLHIVNFIKKITK